MSAPKPVPAVLLLTWALNLGCAQHFHSETVLFDDGSVERAVYQPRDATADAVRQHKGWTQVTAAPPPDQLDRDGWPAALVQLPVREATNERSYFAAWGRFNTVADLPDHVVFKAPERSGLPDGRFRREHTRHDYIFAVEHVWTETLTDVATADGMRRARGELADLFIDVGAEVFSRAVGRDYDATDLVRWCRDEGKAWLSELTDMMFLHCATRKGEAAAEELGAGVAAICARHGLVLRPGGRWLEEEALALALEAFATEKIRKHVRHRRTGQPVDDKTVAAWLREFKADEGKGVPPVFTPVLMALLKEKHGGKEAFQQRCEVLAVRVFGLYAVEWVIPVHHFDAMLTVPGVVLETNGQLAGDNRVRWQFDAREAYPLGYAMTCRSAAAVPRTQKDLLKVEPLANRAALARFVGLVRGRTDLQAALTDCRRKKSIEPLFEYYYRQKENRTPGGNDEATRVHAVLRLLKQVP